MPDRRALTSQERRVVRLVARGMDNREIGSMLAISAKTVKSHLENVFRKTRVRNRVELAVLWTLDEYGFDSVLDEEVKRNA